MIYGWERLLADLRSLGYEAEGTMGGDGIMYVVIRDYEVALGRFSGRIIDLGIMSTPDYPRSVASAVHVKATPQLFENADTIPKIRNITASALGAEWRYWSKNFNWDGERSTRRLISQVNTIFKDA